MRIGLTEQMAVGFTAHSNLAINAIPTGAEAKYPASAFSAVKIVSKNSPRPEVARSRWKVLEDALTRDGKGDRSSGNSPSRTTTQIQSPQPTLPATTVIGLEPSTSDRNFPISRSPNAMARSTMAPNALSTTRSATFFGIERDIFHIIVAMARRDPIESGYRYQIKRNGYLYSELSFKRQKYSFST